MKPSRPPIAQYFSLATVVVVASLLSPALSLADDVTSTNAVTGPNSLNRNQTTDTNNQSINITNTSNVTNTTSLKLNTGGNTVSKNTLGGEVRTGDITAHVDVNNTVNQPSISQTGESANADSTKVNSGNTLTGPKSINNNNTTITTNTLFTEVNKSVINNSISFSGDTGHNKNEKNTFVGPLTTGNIFADIHLANMVGPQIPIVPSSPGSPSTPPLITPPTTSVPKVELPPLTPVNIAMPMPNQPGMGGGFFPSGANILPFLVGALLTSLFAGVQLVTKQRLS